MLGSPQHPLAQAYFALALVSGAPLAVAQEEIIYDITFIDENPPVAHIAADIPMTAPTLQMHSYGAWEEPSGWGTFVHDLQLTDSDGRDVPFEKTDRLEWTIRAPVPEIVRAHYTVEFPYADPEYEWSSVVRSTAGYFDGCGLFLLARTLFLYNDPTQAAQVIFDLPPDWQASTPWSCVGEEEYAAPCLEQMMDNAIVLGRHRARRIQIDEFESTLVFLGYDADPSERVHVVFESIIRDYLSYFQYKEPAHYLMVWFPDRDWETGEGYRDSHVVVTPHPPAEDDRVVWANSIAHESFHFWHGQRLGSDEGAATQWFSEGFTDYVANLTLVRNGIISRREFLNLAQKHFTLYTHFRFKWGTPYRRLSLVEAGAQKSTYNAAVYDGGWVACFALDVMMRTATDNERGLEDALAKLYQEFPDGGPGYTNRAIIDACSQIAGEDLSLFFEEHVAGTQMIPINDLLRAAGFTGNVTVYGSHVRIDPMADSLPSRIRDSLLGDPQQGSAAGEG